MKHDALAGPCDVGKQAVFDGVVLGAVRWVVRDTNIQAQSIRQFPKRLLEDMPVGGIAAPATLQQQQATGMGVVFNLVLHPPVRNAVTAKLAGVAAGVEVHVRLVARQVIESMWDQLANACAGEAMIEHLYGGLRMGMAAFAEVADQLFFLRTYPSRPVARQVMMAQARCTKAR